MSIRDIRPHFVDEPDEDGCWNWLGYCDPNGYGRVKIDGKMRKAYRVSYELSVGPIPEGFDVDHQCWNPSCVNPAHLKAMTNKENIARRREINTHCIHGHPFDEENTGYTGTRRYCMECAREANRNAYIKRCYGT